MITARSNGVLVKRKPFKVLVCLVTLVAFLCNTLLLDSAWAVGTSLELPGGGPNRTNGSGVIKELNVDTFKLPEYLGQIRDSFKAGSDKIVVHIQDAHCNYAAQKKIAEIIEYLSKEHGIRDINLEGGAQEYDLSVFTDIYDKDIRKKTADYFVREGLVNGAEYFAINNPENAALWGIEDTSLYLDNLNIYRNSLKNKDEVDRHIGALNNILNNLKSKIYSKELFDFDTKYSQHKDGTIEFKDYLAYLLQTAKEKLIDIKASTNIYLLSQTLSEEENVDFEKANNQRDELIDSLQKKLSKKSLDELVLKTVEFKSEKISQKDFYAYLTNKSDYIGIDLSNYPELQKYIVYISMYNSINKTSIMAELETLEDKIKEAMYRNNEQRDLNKLSKNLAILKNIFNITLTKEDYTYYTENDRSFEILNYVSFIKKEAPLHQITAKLDDSIVNLDSYRESITKFYECSFKRDTAFLKNIKFNPGRNVALVVTGGFHTENLCEIFKQRNISYISIIPVFSNCEGYQCPYFALLAGKENGIVKTLTPIITSASSIQIASMLSAIAPEVWGKANVSVFDAAVFIQEQVEKGRKVNVTLADGRIVPFGEGDKVVNMSLNRLLKRVHQRNVDLPIRQAYQQQGMYKAVDQKIREDAYRQINEIADALSKLNNENAQKLYLAANQVKNGGVAINLVNVGDAPLEAHAGGRGIHINSKIENDPQKVSSLIVHEAIAGITGDHAIAEAAEDRRTGDAVDLLASMTLPEKPIWEMDAEERRESSRDFASIMDWFRKGKEKPAAEGPPADIVRKSPVSYAITAEGGFEGVDLEHFVSAQTKIAERNLSPQVLSELLSRLKLPSNLTGETVYQKILEKLSETGYSKDTIDIINGDTYQDPRLSIEIIGQNKNPRLQSIFEAIANSLDAQGYSIGQFGKGVKQVVDWLSNGGKDRVDVFTRKENDKAYRLTIIKDTQGQLYIQIKNIPLKEFQKTASAACGQSLEHGTILQVSVADKIPDTETNSAENQTNSQTDIVSGIHKRFPFVAEVDILTQMNGQQAPQKINGFGTKTIIVPPGQGQLGHTQTNGKFVKVAVTSNYLSVTDNGSGMNAEIIARMFVPREGTKRPEPLSGQKAQDEKKKIKVIYDPTLPHRVSFSRNGEVISAIDIPDSISSKATSKGGLSIELAGLMDVPESRDNIQIPSSLQPGEISNFQMGIGYVVDKIVGSPELSVTDKLKYINTIAVGLDGLIQGNANYEQAIKIIRADIQKMIIPMITQLRKEGVIILPHDQQFTRLKIPKTKQVIFLHEKLFDWHGSLSLKELGIQTVTGVNLGGRKKLPLIVAPFTSQSTNGIRQFIRSWYLGKRDERIPIIKTDRFIAIPQELGQRLVELIAKRGKGLSQKEERELASLLERINIITGEEVVTSYEVTSVETNISLAPISQAEEGRIDTEAINQFLSKPPIRQKPTAVPKAEPFHDSFETVKKLVSPASKALAIAEIGKAQAAAGLSTEADRTFNLALKETDRIKNDAEKAICLIIIATKQTDVGMIEKAKITYRDFGVFFKKTVGTNLGPYAYSFMATVAARLDSPGLGRDALNVAMSLQATGTIEEQAVTDAIAAVIEAYAKAGRINEAPISSTNWLYDAAIIADRAASPEKDPDLANALFSQAIMNANELSTEQARILALIEIAKAKARRSADDSQKLFLSIVGKASRLPASDQTKYFSLITIAAANVGLYTNLPMDSNFYKAAALAAMARCYTKDGEIELAERALKEAVEIIKDSQGADEVNVQFEIAGAQAELEAYKITQIKPATQSLLEEAVATAGRIGENAQYARALTAIAVAHAELGATQKAKDIIDNASKMIGEKNASAALIDLAAGYAQIGLFTNAETLFAQAITNVEKNDSPPWDKLHNLGNIMIAQAKAGLAEAAKNTSAKLIHMAEDSMDNETRVFGFTEIARAHAEAGLIKEAMEISEKLSPGLDKAFVLTRIASAQIKTDTAEGAADMLADAYQMTAKFPSDDIHKLNVLISIAQAYIERGREQVGKGILAIAHDEANSLTDEIQKLESLTRIAVIQRKSGLVQDSKDTIRKAIEMSSNLTNDFQKALAVKAIITALIEEELLTEAIIFAEGLEKSTKIKSEAFADIAIAQARAGLFQDAFRNEQRATWAKDSVNVLTEIAIAQARAAIASHAAKQVTSAPAEKETADSLFAAAFATVEEIFIDEHRASALAAIAAAQKDAGLSGSALETITRAYEIIRDDTEYLTIMDVAGGLAKLGLEARARDAFEKAKTSAFNTYNTNDQIYHIGLIATAQAKAGYRDAAVETFAKAIDLVWGMSNVEQAVAFNTIAVAQADAGMIDDARETAKYAFGDLEKAYVLVAIARAQIKAGLDADAGSSLAEASKITERLADNTNKLKVIISIANAYIEAGFNKVANALLRNANHIAAGLTLTSGSNVDKAIAYSLIAGLESKIGVPLEFKETFDIAISFVKLLRPSEYNYAVVTSIINTQIESRQFKNAINFTDQIPIEHLKEHAWVMIIRALIDSGSITAAIDNLRHISDHAAKSNILVDIAAAQAKLAAKSITAEEKAETHKVAKEEEADAKSVLENALVTAEKITIKDHKASALAAIAIAQMKAGSYKNAFSIITRAGLMVENSKEFSALIDVAKAQVKFGLTPSAEDTFRRAADCARDYGESSQVYILSQVAIAQEKSGLNDSSEETFRKAIAIAENITNEEEKAGAFQAIAMAHAEAGLNLPSIQILDKIPASFNFKKAEALAEIAKMQAKKGAIDWAKELINRAIASISNNPDDYLKCLTLVSIAEAQMNSQLRQEAIETLHVAARIANDTTDTYKKDIAFCRIAAQQARLGLSISKTNMAIATASIFSTPREKANFLREIIESYIKSGAIEEAMSFADKDIPESDFKEKAWLTIVVALAKAGSISTALENLEKIINDPSRSAALMAIAIAQAEAGPAQLAEEKIYTVKATPKAAKFEELIEKARELPDVICGHTLVDIAIAQAEAGLMREADNTINEAAITISDLKNDDGYTRAGMLADIARAKEKAGSHEDSIMTFNAAIDTARGIESTQRRIYALTEIAIAEMGANIVRGTLLNEALSLALNITNTNHKIPVLIKIAAAYAKIGFIDDAEKTITLAATNMLKIPADLPKAHLIARLAIAQCEAGKEEDAARNIEIASKLITAASKDADSNNMVTAFCAIAEAQARAGKMKDASISLSTAVTITNTIINDTDKTEANTLLAATYSKIGLFEESDNIINEITDPKSRIYADALTAPARIRADLAKITAVETKTEDDEQTLELWNNNILSQRDKMIRRAQSAYDPILDYIKTNIPEEFQQEALQLVKTNIESLYKNQETYIAERFYASLAGAPLELDDNTLPFDMFGLRMQEIMRTLPGFMTALKPQLSQENYALQSSIYRTLFSNLVEAGRDFDGKIKNIDANFLMALALGWKAHTAEQIEAAQQIAILFSSLQTAAGGASQFETSHKIIQMLAKFSDKDPSKNTPIIIEQLEKIFKLKPAARDKFLTDMAAAFSTIDAGSLNTYAENPQATLSLGKARPFAVFLTHRVEQVLPKTREAPKGEDIRLPDGGVALSQIIKLEQQRTKEGTEDIVMSMDYLIQNLESLPDSSEKLEAELQRNVTVQRESGAYAAEITQNSRDATRNKEGELVIDFYMQNEGAEYVEEAKDNGTGALNEVALMIPKSTKAAGEQLDLTGFFGTGKYTIFEGVDRLEIITKNKDRAFMFTYKTIKDDSGKPLAIRLTGIRKIADPALTQGVTIRRIKSIENTIPELDHLLAQRAWKSFAGLAQDKNFSIFTMGQQNKKEPLAVKRYDLSEAAFKVALPGQEENDFGTLRLISTEDMPLQIVDRAGLRVSEIKQEYLALVPQSLHKFVEKLGINIQIPLPLIRNRSAFEHEDTYLPFIQKYVAVAFYRAVAYKAMTQTDPQFTFADFPFDWETNDNYWNSINPTQDRQIIDIAAKINSGRAAEISQDKFKALLTPKGTIDREQKAVRLILMLEVSADPDKPQVKTSLLGRRIAIQARINADMAQRQKDLLESSGLPKINVPPIDDIPNYNRKLSQAAGIEKGHEQMWHVEDFIIDPKTHSAEERELVDLGQKIGKKFGIEQVILLNNEVSFAGAFRNFKNKNTMFLARGIAMQIGMPSDGILDAATNTVVHELAHLLERFAHEDDIAEMWREGYVSHEAGFTHDATEGLFSEAMRLISAVSLADNAGQIETTVEETEQPEEPAVVEVAAQEEQAAETIAAPEPEKEAAALPEVTAPVSLEARQAAAVEALVSSEQKNNDVNVIILLPKGMRRDEVQPVQSAVNKGLTKNRFGRMEDNLQVVIIEDGDITKTNAQIKYFTNERERLGIKGRTIIFAPQAENRTVNIAADLRKEYMDDKNNVTVIPDAYLDFNPKQQRYPDVMVRVALGRNVAFYRNLINAGKDTKEVEGIINDLLRKITDGTASISEILNFIKVLRILPIDYGEIKKWVITQKAVATSL